MLRAVLNFPLTETQPEVDERGVVHSGESDNGGHQLDLALKCPKAWALKYHLGVERVECPSLDGKIPAWVTGTLVHQWLANHYTNVMGFTGVVNPDQAARVRAQELGYPGGAQAACDLAKKYAQYVTKSRPEWRPIAVEPQLECDFGPAGIFTSGADIVFWDELEDEPVIVDWKTAGRIESNPPYEFTLQYLRYRMVLEQVAVHRGRPPGWGSVYVGVIPTGKTNFGRRSLTECRYFPSVIPGVAEQTYSGLLTKLGLESDPRAAARNPKYGPHCSGPYAGCAYRREFCFVGGRSK